MTHDIEFKNVSFQYEGSQTYALRDLEFSIAPGEIVLLAGPAGSGKTTLCSCINGLVPHYHNGQLTGEVLVRGYNTQRARIGGLSSLVGLVFQDPESQLVTASVIDEVAFGVENLGVPRQVIYERTAAALEATRLAGYEERDPHSLSGGEQQACVIAAIYAMHPEIYVMDEPLANLDPAGRAQVMRIVVEVARQRGKTLLLVEHSLEEVLPLVERLIVLEGGRIVRDGPVEQVLEAGDLPKVFMRPPVVQLADRLGLKPLPLTPDAFYRGLANRHSLPEKPSPPSVPHLPPTGPAVIEFQNVSYSYAHEDGRDQAISNVNLSIHEGEWVSILGRNGSGKTTLVRHIIGLLKPRQGKVLVLGKDVANTPTYELAKEVGFCFQNPNHQIVSFTVKDEMAFGLKAHQIDPSEIPQRIEEALSFVGMQDYLDFEVFDLGKGQKQRLALASVLTLRPRVLVIDEPTTGQDPQMATEIFEILKSLNQMGSTILTITHKIDLAAAYTQRAIVMGAGKVAFDGPVHELLADLDLMQLNSLELPDTTKLASLLARHGVSPWLVTYEDLAHAVDEMLEARHVH
jgi:energy-coupling factor transport system ATP-binding protein